MTKKILLTLALSIITAGGVFSQVEPVEETDHADQIEQIKETKQTDFAGMAKNTITVDIGPTIIGAVISAAIGVTGDTLGGGESLSSSGFGIGAQYERQLAQKFSMAGRFAYLGFGMGISQSYTDQSGADVSVSSGTDMSSFSIESHARYYPLGETFFLDGMLGYANMAVKFSGKMVGTDEVSGQKKEVSVNMDASRGFFKLGAKIGWRISFGRNGGFTFEPAFGYSYGISIGDTFGDQIKKKSGADVVLDVDSFNQAFDILQNIIFIGGPRMTLSFGWRF